MARGKDRPNLALADFVAPEDTGVADYVGGFAVTAGIGEEAMSQRFARANDDYGSILAKALADRLAEAGAEWLHQQVRKEHWGYAADEALSNEELIAEELSTASAPRPAIRRSPTTPRRACCSSCSTRARRSA